MLGSHLGAILNALTALGVAALIVVFGLAPARRALLAEPPPALSVDTPPLLSAESAPATLEDLDMPIAPDFSTGVPGLLEDVALRSQDIARRKVEQLILSDEAHAAAVLKQWMRAREAA